MEIYVRRRESHEYARIFWLTNLAHHGHLVKYYHTISPYDNCKKDALLMMRKTLIFVILTSFVFLSSLPFFVSSDLIKSIFREWGPIETASAVLWFVAVITVILNAKITVIMRALFAFTFVLFGLREMDFQARYTEGTFIKTNYYDDISGLDHYLIGLLAIFLIAVVAVASIVSIRNYWRGTFSTSAADWLISDWGLLIVTKILDRAPAKFRNDLGIQLSDNLKKSMLIMEEGLECLAPIIMIVAFFTLKQFPKKEKSAE